METNRTSSFPALVLTLYATFAAILGVASYVAHQNEQHAIAVLLAMMSATDVGLTLVEYRAWRALKHRQDNPPAGT